MSQTVREIAERWKLATWYDLQKDTIGAEDIRALAGHVLASTEPLGDERLQNHLSALRNGLSRDWKTAADAIETEIRRLQEELKGAENINSHHVADLDDRDALIADLRAQLQAATIRAEAAGGPE